MTTRVPTDDARIDLSLRPPQMRGRRLASCPDGPAQGWAEETDSDMSQHHGLVARVTATEFGDQAPVETAWPTPKADRKTSGADDAVGVDGGTFWHWEDVAGDALSSFADPVKRRAASRTPPCDASSLTSTASTSQTSRTDRLMGRLAEDRRSCRDSTAQRERYWQGSFVPASHRQGNEALEFESALRRATRRPLTFASPLPRRSPSATGRPRPSRAEDGNSTPSVRPDHSLPSRRFRCRSPRQLTPVWVPIELSSSTAIDVDGLR